MSAGKSGYFRHPKTTNEKRRNASFVRDEDAAGAKGRVRTHTTRSALVDAWDDLQPAARSDRSRGKPSHSPARKARERARWD